MKRQFFIFLLLLSLAFKVAAQVEEARKIDEFESVTCDDLLGRLDVLAAEVNKLPNSKGYIIVYEGKGTKYKLNSDGYLRPTSETVQPAFGESAHMTKYMMYHLLRF